jgi:Superinfection exclusion gene product 17
LVYVAFHSDGLEAAMKVAEKLELKEGTVRSWAGQWAKSGGSTTPPPPTLKSTKPASTPKPGDLEVWWMPQLPCEEFRWRVKSPDEALMVVNMLAAYDDFQFAHNVKPDYANAGGLEVFNDQGEWEDWFDEDGNEFEDLRRRYLRSIGLSSRGGKK